MSDGIKRDKTNKIFGKQNTVKFKHSDSLDFFHIYKFMSRLNGVCGLELVTFKISQLFFEPQILAQQNDTYTYIYIYLW